jgi:hypothetical protein
MLKQFYLIYTVYSYMFRVSDSICTAIIWTHIKQLNLVMDDSVFSARQ